VAFGLYGYGQLADPVTGHKPLLQHCTSFWIAVTVRLDGPKPLNYASHCTSMTEEKGVDDSRYS
jgi:hypothetical protein